MVNQSKEHEYAKTRRRINILGGVIFIAFTAAFILTATQLFNADWTEWWVVLGGLVFGFSVALASSILMEYASGRQYQQINLPLWEYVLIRFRFLFILFLVPMAIAVLVSVLVSVFFEGSLAWTILLARTLGLVFIIALAGFALPYWFGKVTGAEKVGSEGQTLVYKTAEKIGVNIQGVYKVPMKGLRGANAIQTGFLKGRRVVYILGGWEKHFTEDELGAVLAHEFAHAKYNHIRKLLTVQLLCHVGVPGIILLAVAFLIRALQIPKPAPIGIVVAIIVPAIALNLGSFLFPRWLSRSYETQADAEAARVYGAQPMISALGKLAELNLIPKERSHPLSTHPSIKTRISALKQSWLH